MEFSFVRPESFYESYVDFWKLVTLSGFPICRIKEVDLSKKIAHIVSPINPEWEEHLETQRNKDRRAFLILWDLERPIPRGGLGQMKDHAQSFLNRRLFDEIWTSDKLLADETGFRFIVLGSDKRLGRILDGQIFYQICHFMHLNERRETLLEKLEGISIAPNAYPPRRNRILEQSGFGLTIHQDGQPYQEPLRLSLFAAYGLPVISEFIADPYPWSEETMILGSYEDIPKIVKEKVSNRQCYIKMGKRAQDMMCGFFRFKEQVLKAVEDSTGRRPFPVAFRRRNRLKRVEHFLRSL